MFDFRDLVAISLSVTEIELPDVDTEKQNFELLLVKF